MPFFTYSPMLSRHKEFKRVDEKSVISGDEIRKLVEASAIFYFIKKDKHLENRVRKFLMQKEHDLPELANSVRNMVYDTYPWLKEITYPQFVELEGKVQRLYCEVWDLKENEVTKDFVTEAFTGIVKFQLPEPHAQKLCYAFQSYAEALARIEKEMLEDHPLATEFYPRLITELRSEGCPARLGYWTDTPYEGHLLFFWRVKEIRQHLTKEFGLDIRPTEIIYIPSRGETAGWAYWRQSL
ncbi:MAG: hypothetical protein GXO48_08155 [Chlorobi bacterium]|nr:hypothetical protein [Chlorobiota bacterium]